MPALKVAQTSESAVSPISQSAGRPVLETDTLALQLFDAAFPSPAENLACDEALLDVSENSEDPGFLRFWESPSHFVVLGYGKHLQSEVFREACAEAGIPILRRCSGGGTVLQGPGSFNYTLILPINHAPEL